MTTQQPLPVPNPSARSISPLLRVCAFVLPLALITVIYRRYAMTFGTHSDFCNFLLQGDAVLHGNPFLRHWYLTTISFYTTDVLYFSIGMALRGFNPILVHEVPAVVFSVILGLALFTAANQSWTRRSHWIAATGVVFALIGIPDKALAFHLLTGTLHVGIMVPILVALLAVDARSGDGAPLSLWRVALFFLALTAAAIADTMAVFIVIVPWLLVSAAELRTEKAASRRRDLLWIGAASLAAAPSAKLVLHLFGKLGGFKMPDMYSSHVSFIPFADISKNVGNTIESLLLLYGGDFWGLPLGRTSGIALVHLIGAGVVVYALGAALLAWWRAAGEVEHVAGATKSPEIDRISAVLALGMAINLVSYTISNLQVGLDTTRYLAPFAIMGAILAGRWLVNASPYRRGILYAVGAYGLISLFGFYAQLRQPRTSFDTPPAHLGAWLRDHNMSNAYGEYWSASAVTVLSHRAALVRPVMEIGGKMAPDLCSVDERWYETPIHCLVMGTQNAENVNPKTAKADFGLPDKTYELEGYTIFWYEKDLTPLLAKSPYAVP